MVPLKTCQEIDKMQEAGHILKEVMQELAGLIQPGIASRQLDAASIAAMTRFGVRSAFKGYRGYPGNICISVNEEVVHGIPGKRKLEEGDIVGVDIGIELDGFFVDMAETFPVGRVSAEKQKLIEVARASLDEAIKAFKPGNMLSDISFAVQHCVETNGFSVVRDFVGHGIGRELHEEPQIPNFVSKDKGPMLKDGMVFAIEPMINAGGWEVEVLKDGWTAVTKDRRPSAHVEHTVALVNGAAKILTQ